MALTYQGTPYALEAERAILDAYPLASGLDETDSDALVALSAAFSPTTKVSAAVVVAGKDATVTITGTLKVGYRVRYVWGDGTSSQGTTLSAVHTYPTLQYELKPAWILALAAKTYPIVVTIEQPGLPSIDLSLSATIA